MENPPGALSGRIALVLKIILPLIIILTGIAAYNYLKKTGPTTERRPPSTFAPVVQVKALFPENHRAVINAMGTVIPARKVELRSRVSGEVMEVHPEFSEGGMFKAGTKMIRIDATDYHLALSQKEKALADAEYELKLELGRQEVARREWQLLDLDKVASAREIELALRKPHLEKARASLTAAEADVKKTLIDIARTEISAPFNAMITTRNVNVGSQVSENQPLADLVGTDSYWIQASVPIERLNWLRIPQKHGDPASDAQIFYSGNFALSGKVIRLMGDISREGRMARVLIEVRDPLGLERYPKGQPPLLLGDFVRIQIIGKQLENVFQIPRIALRDNSFIWTVNKISNLEIKKVEILWRESDIVLIDGGVKPGDLLILTDLSAPVDGMPVQLDTSESISAQPDQSQLVPGKS